MPAKNISANELRKLIKAGDAEIIDVRPPEEFKIVHIKGSKLASMSELPNRMNEIDWRKQVVFVCRSGARSSIMSQVAAQAGFEAKNLQYGIAECFREGKSDNLQFDKEFIGDYFG